MAISKIDTSELRKIITGRVVPHIYSFLTNTLPNYLKVGDTYRPIEERLNEWRRFYKDLEEVSRHRAIINDEVFFRDYAVHKYLQQKGISQIPRNVSKNVYSNEFFEGAKKSDVSKAIEDIVNNYRKADIYEYYSYDDAKSLVEYHHPRTLEFAPRQNQQEVIDNFGIAVKKGRTNLLMYAVMRFGKSITSMWSAKTINSKFTVVVSAKADVHSEWKHTIESHKDFTGYRFLDKNDLKKGMRLSALYGQKFKTGSGDEEICTNIVLFLTLQDLAGSTDAIKDHHRILQSIKINLLIIDETHFGARAPVLGKILAGVEVDEEDKKLLKNDNEDSENLGALNKLGPINAEVNLHLSGTPYRILMGSEFEQEDIIAFVQFSDIYEAKLQWKRKHLDEDEWDNPYYGFPQMIRFAFNPNESSRKKLVDIAGGKPAELFEPVSKKKSGDYEIFQHEQEIVDLLEVLDGSKNDTNMLGLLDNESVKAGKLAQHIVIVLPYCASCDSLEKLVLKNKKLFRNISEYEIFNISGFNKVLATPEQIKSAIAKAEAAGKKTITLTVNKMLTGATVPQWDTMIYLKGTASPQEYDQAIFRLQSPWVKRYEGENGNVIKYDMKPQTLLVDLDPTRLFHLQELKAFTYGANTENFGNERIEEFIKRELAISPIITLNAEGNKLVEVTATNVIDEARKYSNSRTITEDVQEIGVDVSLKDNPAIFEVISKLAELGSKNGLNIRPNVEEGGEWDGVASQGDVGEFDDAIARPGKDSSGVTEDISSFERRFRTYYVMILLFAFLSNTKEKSLADVIQHIDADENNRRIARNLGLKKSDLEVFRNNLNPFIRSELDYKIQNADFRSSDDSITPVQHLDIAIHKFGRLSEAEVFTPSRIVSKMYDAFDVKFWRGAKGVKVLDIASKSGVFAKGFVENALKHGLKIEEIKNNFYSIPTSPAAYEFTRKMYQALGLNLDNIARHFNSFDLIARSEEDVRLLLSQNKKFSDIRLSDLEKPAKMKDMSNSSMKFAAVVGNPPYQINTDTNFAKPVYNQFFEFAKALGPSYVALIMPARFLSNAGATPKEWNKKMLNDPHISIPIHELESEKVFTGVDIKGGIVVVFWDKSNPSGGLGGRYIRSEELKLVLAKTKTGGFDAVVGPRGETKLKIVLDEKYPNDLRIAPNYFERFPNVFKKIQDSKHQIKIIGLEKGNKRTSRYISQDIVNDPKLKKWKVFLPESNGSGAIGEVLSTPLVGEPLVGCTYTFLQVGSFNSRLEAESCMKYIKTKFCRALLGTIKITQHNTRDVWKNVPVQDFTKKSDIDWTKSITDIDKQLYKKYGLDKHEIDFIEANVKAMN